MVWFAVRVPARQCAARRNHAVLYVWNSCS
jgi:hypothetical protein